MRLFCRIADRLANYSAHAGRLVDPAHLVAPSSIRNSGDRQADAQRQRRAPCGCCWPLSRIRKNSAEPRLAMIRMKAMATKIFMDRPDRYRLRHHCNASLSASARFRSSPPCCWWRSACRSASGRTAARPDKIARASAGSTRRAAPRRWCWAPQPLDAGRALEYRTRARRPANSSPAGRCCSTTGRRRARAGFYLLMPLRMAGTDTHVLVARGWLPRDPPTQPPARRSPPRPATVTVTAWPRADAGQGHAARHAGRRSSRARSCRTSSGAVRAGQRAGSCSHSSSSRPARRSPATGWCATGRRRRWASKSTRAMLSNGMRWP